jgi:hypothetical protein
MRNGATGMSHTLTLEIPEDVYESLLEAARQTGQRPETLAVQWLAQVPKKDVDDPLEQFIGAFNSQGSDWIEKHDDYLGEAGMQNQSPTHRDE